MRKPIPNRAELIEHLPAFVIRGMSDKFIASKYGCATSTIANIRKELGITRNKAGKSPRDPSWPPKRCPMVAAFEANPWMAAHYRDGV